MTVQFHPFWEFFKYWLLKEDLHSLQSPYVFRIYQGLMEYVDQAKDADREIEKLRYRLLRDDEVLQVRDYGAGSKKLQKQLERKTSAITKHSTTGRKFSQLYQYFCGLTPAINVLELGTCVDLNTRYLSRSTMGTLYTFEGSGSLIQKAKELQPPSNTQYILGNIKDTLPKQLEQIRTVDFALIDATHTYRGTVRYFEMLLPHLQANSILAIADIHWSREMSAAWEVIKSNPRVSLSMDFFECGILIFKKNFPKSEYVLDY